MAGALLAFILRSVTATAGGVSTGSGTGTSGGFSLASLFGGLAGGGNIGRCRGLWGVGFNDQSFGVDEQNLGRGPSD
jgi:hypothetical protein